MSNRNFVSFDDQAQAMAEGYSSTTEWALHKLINMVQELTDRVDRLEGVATLTEEGFLDAG